MKKRIIIALLGLMAFGLVACNKDGGGNISPYKDYDLSFDYDYVAFGVHRFVNGLSESGIDAEDVVLMNKPLNSETKLLSGNDLLALGLLNDSQKLDFQNYCQETDCRYFKLSLIIPNDPQSDDYGKQLIRITNLDYLTDHQIDDGLAYNLYYESTILVFDQLKAAACTALGVSSIDPFVLNNSDTGIYFWDYESTNDTVTLKFYVINAQVLEEDSGTYLNQYTMEWFDFQL